MPRSTLLLAVLVALAAPAWGEPREKPPTEKAASIPDNRHDPEDRGESASSGASARQGAPGAATDLGKEADKEEDAYRPKAPGRLGQRTPQATKPNVRNLR